MTGSHTCRQSPLRKRFARGYGCWSRSSPRRPARALPLRGINVRWHCQPCSTCSTNPGQLSDLERAWPAPRLRGYSHRWPCLPASSTSRLSPRFPWWRAATWRRRSAEAGSSCPEVQGRPVVSSACRTADTRPVIAYARRRTAGQLSMVGDLAATVNEGDSPTRLLRSPADASSPATGCSRLLTVLDDFGVFPPWCARARPLLRS